MEPMTVHITLTKTSITMSMATACPRQSGQARQPARQPGQAANQAAMDKNVHDRGLLQAVRPGQAASQAAGPGSQPGSHGQKCPWPWAAPGSQARQSKARQQPTRQTAAPTPKPPRRTYAPLTRSYAHTGCRQDERSVPCLS